MALELAFITSPTRICKWILSKPTSGVGLLNLQYNSLTLDKFDLFFPLLIFNYEYMTDAVSNRTKEENFQPREFVPLKLFYYEIYIKKRTRIFFVCPK